MTEPRDPKQAETLFHDAYASMEDALSLMQMVKRHALRIPPTPMPVELMPAIGRNLQRAGEKLALLQQEMEGR